MKQTYTGGCQCGKVRYEASTELGEVISCNCSRCGRLGSLLAFVPAQDFKLPRFEPPRRRVFSQDEVALVLAQPDRSKPWGATLSMAGQSRAMASASCGVSVMMLPEPRLTLTNCPPRRFSRSRFTEMPR